MRAAPSFREHHGQCFQRFVAVLLVIIMTTTRDGDHVTCLHILTCIIRVVSSIHNGSPQASVLHSCLDFTGWETDVTPEVGYVGEGGSNGLSPSMLGRPHHQFRR